ncbi:MAG TPA: alpha-amylase family glycosyl hydrolase [Opitutaceae bacterium]|nr:alpha-amylase family glycosyl hydrolase [Opitutaceae bacterium]
MNAITRSRRPLLSIMLALLGALPLGAESPRDWSAVAARPSPAWIREAVVYEIFPRQFSPKGDFAGVAARLDELKALGVDVLWLMPIHPIGHLKAKGTIGSPYAVQDYYAVNPDYGTKEDFRRLVEGAHARGLKVIIDIVANHTAWDSVMMSNPSFYKRDASGQVIPPHPEWADVAGLNYANPETRRYMREMLQYWARDFQLDGFRCDAAAEVPTDFWEEARADLDKVRPGLFLLAEADKPDLLVHAFDADYAWSMLGTLNKVLMKGAPASELRRTWEESEQRAFPRGALHLRFTDNHDEARAISRFGWNGALAASAMMFTLDGVPLLYNGMEVGDTSESGDPALFEKLPIFWQPKQRESFRETYRQLIALRHGHPALSAGAVVWLENSAPQNVVTFLRRGDAEELVTVVNFSNRPQSAAIRVEHGGDFSLVLKPSAKVSEAKAGLPEVALGAYEWRIYHRPL